MDCSNPDDEGNWVYRQLAGGLQWEAHLVHWEDWHGVSDEPFLPAILGENDETMVFIPPIMQT